METNRTIPAALAIDGLSGVDARGGFDLAAGAGYRGVAFATNHPELNPEALGPSARRQVKAILAGKGLRVESVRAAGPRGGLSDSGTIDRTLEQARKAMTLAREMGVGTVAVYVGMLEDRHADAAQPAPRQASAPVPPETVVAALRELAQQADAAGLTLALSAGGGIEALARVLKAVDFERAQVNLDGAGLIGAGEDVLAAADLLAGAVGQLTASDAVKSGRGVRAAVLGEGQLPVRELVALLHAQGFAGPWVVDVRDLADGAAAARRAAEVLRGWMRR
jgi:sugar phosphate isomerase/epimerase